MTPLATLDDIRKRTTVSITEAAILIGVSRATAYEAAARGELPVLRLGRRMVVPVPRLLAMLEGTDS